MALTPEEMEQIPNAISNAFSELEIGIFEDLIGRIKENNEITGTAEYDIFKLIQLGESEKVIKNYVQKALKITYSEIEEIFGDVFETGYNRDNDLFKAVGADFIAYKDNEPLQQYIAAIKEQTRGTYKNITNTMGFVRQREGTNTWVPLTKYYKDSLTRAVIEITSGSFSYTQVVKKIINEMTNSGIRTIDYASGKTSRIEVAARRAIQTAVTQVAAKVTEQNMEKLHTEYVEVSWHATARPTHQVWQGRVFRWNRGKESSDNQNAMGIIKNVAKTVDEDILNKAKILDLMISDKEDAESIYSKQELLEEMSESPIGQKTIEFIEKDNVAIQLDNNRQFHSNRGYQQGNIIKIFLNNTGSKLIAAQTIIHEMTHYHYNIGNCQHAEAVCFAMEKMHKERRDYLFKEEWDRMVKLAVDNYPELEWEAGGYGDFKQFDFVRDRVE